MSQKKRMDFFPGKFDSVFVFSSPPDTVPGRKESSMANPSVELRLAAWNKDLGRAQRALDAGADPDYTGGGPGYEGSTNALNNAA